MNELQVFNNEKFGQVRMVEIDGKPYAIAKDVAIALGYKNTNDAIIKHCKGIVKYDVLTNGGTQSMTVISEGDIYRLITKSKLPDSEKFELWLFDEVLPSIRKHGAYMSPETIERTLADPDFIIGLATELKKERAEKLLLQEENEILKPKAELADQITSADSLMNFIEVADVFKVCGRNTLMKILREDDILMNGDFTKNIPKSQYIKNGYFSVIIRPRKTSDGMQNIATTLCKPKALKLVHKVLKERELIN